MGLFDKMFAQGASADQQQPNAQQRFDQLKQKYQSVLNEMERQQVQLQNLHVQDDKLFLKGTAPSEDVKKQVWDQIKLVNPSADDITADITVTASEEQVATLGGDNRNAEIYTIKSGDTQLKINKQYYNEADEYMRISYASRDKLKDPDKIEVGQELTIPEGNT